MNIKIFSIIERFEIELYGLMVPVNVGFCICAESINLLAYDKGLCGLIFAN